jgi:hypothetical protein
VDYTCAIMSYGQVMCCGNNDQGQLANGNTTDSTVPTLATLITGISEVDAGLGKSCGLTGTGLVRCLNDNAHQDLGSVAPASKGQKITIVDTWTDGVNTWVQLGPERWINIEQDGKPVLDLID